MRKWENDKSPRTPEGGQALKKDNTYQFDNQGLFEAKGMRVARAEEMGELENEEMGEWENERMWEWENVSLFEILGERYKLNIQIVEY